LKATNVNLWLYCQTLPALLWHHLVQDILTISLPKDSPLYPHKRADDITNIHLIINYQCKIVMEPQFMQHEQQNQNPTLTNGGRRTRTPDAADCPRKIL
jgi:hypothetical protein